MFATMQIIICAGIARLVNAALRLDPKSIKGREIGASVCLSACLSACLSVYTSSRLLLLLVF